MLPLTICHVPPYRHASMISATRPTTLNASPTPCVTTLAISSTESRSFTDSTFAALLLEINRARTMRRILHREMAKLSCVMIQTQNFSHRILELMLLCNQQQKRG